MSRFFMRFAWILVVCLWVGQAYAAKSTGTAVSPIKSPAASSSQDGPVLEIPEMTHDFGEVMEGDEVVYEFKVRNTGKSDLQINQVRPG